MKTQANKLLAVVCAIAMIMTMIVPMSITVSAAEETSALDFTNAANCTSIDATQQVWEENGLTITNLKGSSTTAVNNYDPSGVGHSRFYKNSTATIECSNGNITSIVFTCTASKYAGAPTVTGGTAATSGTTITITMTEPTSSVSLTFSGSQVRTTAMTVTYEVVETGDPSCQHTNTTVLEAVAATCTEDGLTEGLQCADCEAILTPRTTIAAIGHSNLTLDEANSTSATCTTDGENVSICGVCGETVTEVVKATGHGNLTLDESASTSATCTTDGENVYTCDVCGETIREVVRVTSHTYVDNVCTSCGYTMDTSKEETATITFDDTSKRTEFDTDHQVWVENGITVTNNKASSTTNMADYTSPVRFYKNSELVIAVSTYITKIVFNCNTTDYATTLAGCIGDSATASDKLVTVELSGDSTTYTFTFTGGQVRVDSIEVTYYKGLEAGECGHDSLTLTSETPATCTTNGERISTCDTCGETITEVIEATGHTFADEVCTVCGANEYTEATIAEALLMADDTKIIIKNVVVAEINAAWNSTYNNITVTVKDQDTGDTLYVYRLATNVAVGDIITIKGAMGSYNGSKQVAQGATAEITGQTTVDGPDYVEVGLDEAVTLDDGAYVSVTGTVTEVNTAWSDSNQNMSVTISDDNSNTLYIYKLGTKVEIGDIITVQGKISTYNNAKQVIEGTAEIIGKVEVTYTEVTIDEAIKLEDSALVLVTGTVTQINTAWSDSYNNISVTISDANGNTLYVYRLATNVALGDVITVKGAMATYNEARQIAAGATAEIIGACEHANTTTEVTEATCTTEGVIKTVCAFCNKVISTEAIPTTDHAWVAGDMVDFNITYTCSVCGETKVEAAPYVAGDANADGDVDLNDAVLVQVYLANMDFDTGVSSTIVALGADADDDGDIDLNDAVLLALYLANFDFETGTSTIVLGKQNA